MKPSLLDAIQQRYACREFIADRPVSADELVVLLEAGRLAPSAFGLEPWRFVSVTEAPGKAAIAHACFDQPAAATAAVFIAIVALVDDLNPDSDYVRARFTSRRAARTPRRFTTPIARSTTPMPSRPGRRASATLPQRTCCCRRRIWGSAAARSADSTPPRWPPP